MLLVQDCLRVQSTTLLWRINIDISIGQRDSILSATASHLLQFNIPRFCVFDCSTMSWLLIRPDTINPGNYVFLFCARGQVPRVKCCLWEIEQGYGWSAVSASVLLAGSSGVGLGTLGRPERFPSSTYSVKIRLSTSGLKPRSLTFSFFFFFFFIPASDCLVAHTSDGLDFFDINTVWK